MTDSTPKNQPEKSAQDQVQGLFSAIFDNTYLGILWFEGSGKVLGINPTLLRWLGIDSLGASAEVDVLLPALKEKTAVIRNTPHRFDTEVFSFSVARKGVQQRLAMRGYMVCTQEHPVLYMLQCWFAEAASASRTETPQQVLSQLMDFAPIGIFSLARDWSCNYANPEFYLMAEATEGSLLGKGWIKLFDDKMEQLHRLIDTLLKKGSCREELTIRQLDNKTRILELELRASVDESGRLLCAVGSAFDVTERVERQNHIHKLANYDSLTNLYNRYALRHQLERYLSVAQHNHQPVHVLFVDLDGFKSINDVFGHQTGDEVLKAVATRMQASVRQSDIVARIGGDEFVVLLAGINDNQVVNKVASTILVNISTIKQVGDLEVNVGASIGVAHFCNEHFAISQPVSALANELLQQADIAMYAAKQSGKNTTHWFSAKYDGVLTHDASIVHQLPQAIARNELFLCYQPIICPRNEQMVGVEALIRWSSDSMGELLPDRFIPVAEGNGQILAVQRWMMERVKEEFIQIRQALNMPALRLNINISARELNDAGHVQSIIDLFIGAGLARYITLEVTESCLLDEEIIQGGQLDRLAEEGFHLALDDFGSGYSSLSYLAKFPIHFIKLDKSFLNNDTPEPQRRSLLSSVVQLGHGLSKQVVVEGVETEAELDLVTGEHCDLIQGYYFARPMPRAELINWSRERHVH